ncbi:predicted protein [Naegleria gruberi]|uniref:Predicted protein n=1 Tax=Naegleria gruberi TaxID=5762 RepID=D2W425_NAEGR|nr:uncharacterized protein NAEGRDRAFT_76155 [Naegleria gruberi]EFC36187.1 predicted protein [Naegleria gruberi]|eukprot:XP_002668931.1 predicted protein [Naegleria gruberi strain NEG-M]
MFEFGGFGLFNGFSFNSELKTLLISEANNLGYQCIQSQPPKLFMQDSGLLLLTRHEILESENYIFQYASYTEYIVAKGILYALIKKKKNEEGDADYLMIFSVHMDAHKDRSRREQIKELVQFVNDKIDNFRNHYQIDFENVRVVICGDYNIDSLHSNDSYAYLKNSMSSLGLKNVFGDDTSRHPVTYPIPTFNNWCLDHVFISNNCKHSFDIIRWKNEDGIEVSDHYGVRTTIHFE